MIRETMVVPVGWNEYGEIAEDRLFETYQPTIWATISFLCLYQNCMYYKRDNVLYMYMSSYDSQCHVGKWSYFHWQKQNCSKVLLILTFGLQKWLMEGDFLPSTLWPSQKPNSTFRKKCLVAHLSIALTNINTACCCTNTTL